MTETIARFLPENFPWKDRIICFDTIDSTNTAAKAMALQGAPQGTAVIADTQTGGRGRLGRSFHSPGGKGVYLSLILRPRCSAEALMHLTCAVGCAMCDAVEAVSGIRPGIKWINDLVCGKRKLGGILVELGFAPGGTVDYAVIGVGINCLQKAGEFPPELTATSLLQETGKAVSREALIAAMLVALEKMSRELLTRQEAILACYRSDCVTIGKEVSLQKGDEVRHGVATGVDAQGALLVRFPDGHTEAIAMGEVSVRGMYGYVP